MKEKSKHRGISAFELLIVIALIVILSSAVVLSSTRASTTADAALIIANMRAVKQATIDWYADNRDRVREVSKQKWNIQDNNETMKNIRSEICKYLRADTSFTLNENKDGKIKEGGYGLYNVAKYRATWYVGYKFNNDEGPVKEKLKAQAKTLGLHFTNEKPSPNGIDPGAATGDSIVWMHVLGELLTTSPKWN